MKEKMITVKVPERTLGLIVKHCNNVTLKMMAYTLTIITGKLNEI